MKVGCWWREIHYSQGSGNAKKRWIRIRNVMQGSNMDEFELECDNGRVKCKIVFKCNEIQWVNK